MKVKIKPEKDYYLAYFLDSRRVVEINKFGSIVLDSLFNQGQNANSIAKKIATECGEPFPIVKKDIADFLSQIKKELNPTYFNAISQKQLNSPLGIELEIITACNLSCIHCLQEHQPKGQIIPTTKAIEIIDILADAQICEMSLMGGEPVKHPGLIDILEHCRKRDIAVSFVTNGTLLNEVLIERLANIEGLIILVSLDGTKQIHNRIRGKGVFERLEKNLKLMISKGLSIEAICTLNAVNISAYKEVADYCMGLDIPCNFNLFKPFKPSHRDLVLSPEVFFSTLAELLKMRRDGNYKIGLSSAAIVAEMLGLPPKDECRATRSGLVIDVNGHMIPCPALAIAGHYQEEDLPLLDHNFLDKWRNHEIFTQFRENGLKECQARSFLFDGDVKGFDPYGITAFRQYAQKMAT